MVDRGKARAERVPGRGRIMNPNKTGPVPRRLAAEGVFPPETMNVWDQILARIETKVNRHSFYTWFKPTSFIAEDRGSVTVRVPNDVFKDWLTKHYSGVITEAMTELKRPHLTVHFVAEARFC